MLPIRALLTSSLLVWLHAHHTKAGITTELDSTDPDTSAPLSSVRTSLCFVVSLATF